MDAKGKLYFVDRFFQRIHGFTPAEGLTTVSDAPLDPVNLAVDRSGRLLCCRRRGVTAASTASIPPSPTISRDRADRHPRARRRDDAVAVNLWANGEFADRIDPASYQYPPLAAFFTSK